ncbi:MAG: nuclear transport factor 2 family protein [Gammaproteobacteria bacterium]|nr:nuclear transport factor 2 family protein [Gammaproteobacteria bacterium]
MDIHAEVEALGQRLQRLEDIEAVRRLHYIYGYFMDYCRYDEVVDLFAEGGEAVFLSGVYKGHKSLARLYKDFLGQVYTKGEPCPRFGFVADHHLLQEVITLSDDGHTANFRGRCYMVLGSHHSRPDMPELLPLQVYEAALYENTYIKVAGVWKIQRLEYSIQWQALYEKGWAHTAVDLKPATVTYPENPIGPDFFIDQTQSLWPERSAVPYHYVHPVTGRPIE